MPSVALSFIPSSRCRQCWAPRDFAVTHACAYVSVLGYIKSTFRLGFPCARWLNGMVYVGAPRPAAPIRQQRLQRTLSCIHVVQTCVMPFTDVLPARGLGLASCSYARRRRSVVRRPGRGATVPRARRSQQGDQRRSPSSEAVGIALGVFQHQLSGAAPALAEDMAAYDASGVSDSLKNAFGVAYVAVLIGFGIRLFSKRAQRFTTEVRSLPLSAPPLFPPKGHPGQHRPHANC